MPIIELDALIAFVNASDKLHRAAARLFDKICAGKIKGAKAAASAYLEYELVLRSRGYPTPEIREHLAAFKNLPNLGEAPLNLNAVLKAFELREEHGLSYFDSLHAATALLADGEIISSDEAYRKVEGLKVTTLQEI